MTSEIFFRRQQQQASCPGQSILPPNTGAAHTVAEMGSASENKDLACFLTPKHTTWKGKYKRVFSVGTLCITTYNPTSMEKTNQWQYSDVVGVSPSLKGVGPALNNELILTMRKGKKTDCMRFSTEHRAELLTEALKFRHHFTEKGPDAQRYDAYKYHWSDSRLPVVLEVTPCSLNQLDPSTGEVLASYYYKDFEALAEIADSPDGFVVIYGGFGRMHGFASHFRSSILQKVQEQATNHIGIYVRVRKDHVAFEELTSHRFGKYSLDDLHLTSISEFTVHKQSCRHKDPVRRTLCLTETCLLERDPQTYNICTLRPLGDIFALVRSKEDPQMFTVEYIKGQIRTYTSTDRDALLASLMDGVRASGNRDIHVRMTPTDRGKRLGPFTVPVDEEVESMHLKFLQQLPCGWDFSSAVERFNSNVSYSGLLHAVTGDSLFAENKEKLIMGAIQSLLTREGDQISIVSEDLEAQFQALRRLVASKAGFSALTSLPGFREKVGVKVVKALKRGDDSVTHAAVDMICALMVPMHDDYDLRQEQLNKSSLLSSKVFLESLLNMWVLHVNRGTSALVVAAMLDFLTFALCAPYSETTDGKQFDTLLEMVAEKGRPLFRLFQHPSSAIVKGAGLVMKAIIEEGEPEIAARMQDLALAEGALPRHLLTAMFTQSTDGRMLTNRQLSRHLVGLWVTGHPTAMGLLKRIMPTGLLSYLDSEENVEETEEERLHVRDNLKLAQDQQGKQKNKQWAAVERQLRQVERQVEAALQHWRSRMGLERNRERERVREKPVVLRKRRERIKSEANWRLFYHQFGKDHALPDLIWNMQTREELREALEGEIRGFMADRDLSSGREGAAEMVVSWNHAEFEVRYRSLAEEIRIGDYYLRLLLEKDESGEGFDSPIKRSYEFFNDLYHRFLLTPKIEMKCLCLQAMTIVYGKHHDEIGAFGDTKYIVGMLERSTDRLERDRLVLFLDKLVLNRHNVKELMDANGLEVLVDLLTLAHLHTSRAVVPTQTNVIEASADMTRESEKEWYYGNIEKERKGPVGFDTMKQLWTEGVLTARTRCWAQGMKGWRPLHSVSQLKWGLLADGLAVLNESRLATLILDMLARICRYFPSRDSDGAVIRPLPRSKQLLSAPTCLPHIVQLLLTFDPVLVERVATLLHEVMQDNPHLPKIYLLGIFYFILMYTGSNLLPIARFLHLAHLKQAFHSDDVPASSIMQRSILGQLLPEAMVSYLENHGSEKFAQIFLGEFDTPEAIWSAEMRRNMIEKIAAHICDFSPRLQSNTRALYQYCAIPCISYIQLENELFCGTYYLRHLCDTSRFPDWPIRDPVNLLKEILVAWQHEVEKKPPAMSVDEAYLALELPTGCCHEDSKVRKAYFRLAQQFHPDKNPTGRDAFEKVNKAYEFLCSRTSRATDGPDPEKIVLILQGQSILFHRYKDELHPYKYAGYPMLIKTIEMETVDETLFSKSAPLLAAASELAYHTVNCSALNAEELRREKGLETLLAAYSRCVAVLSRSSHDSDVAVQVCTHVTKCYTVAAQFQQCRDRLVEMPHLIRDLCHILYYRHLTRLCAVATSCASALALDNILQMHLLQAGILWHILPFMFGYDFTLEEGGVEKSESTHQQEVANQLAKLAVKACARLAGLLEGEEATPPNAVVLSALDAMLTPYLSKQLKSSDREDGVAALLKTLNSNTRSPYLLWDNATRAELGEYLQEQQQSKVRTGHHDESFGSEFVFSVHAKELIVGGIFVRVYNEQPTFPLEDARGFTANLLDYLGSQAQYLHSLMVLSGGESGNGLERLSQVESSLEALGHVIRNNPGVETCCIGHFRLLFCLLRVDGASRVQKLALEAISVVTGSRQCVEDVANADVLVYLLLVLHALDQSACLTALSTLHALFSSARVVKDSLAKGAVMYLLDMFCNSSSGAAREKCAELLSKMAADKLVGPRVRLIVGRFLPPVMLDAMRESAEGSVHVFEGAHENPELVWDDKARRHVRDTIRAMTRDLRDSQRADPDHTWKPPDLCVYTCSDSEVVVGGVFLRLFVQNPGWVLRRPREFLADLLDASLSTVKDEAHLELVTNALVALLQTQPNLAEHIPALGHIPKLFQSMAVGSPTVTRSCVRVAHRLCTSEACLDSMSQSDSVPSIKRAMQYPECVGLACEALNRMFSSPKPREDLVSQAVRCQLVPHLLSLLEGRDPASTKAQAVEALKAMASGSSPGAAQVSAMLDKSKVWSEYRDQKHDLFITGPNTAGFLTGSSASVPAIAGYLSGSQKGLPDAPPPLDSHEDSFS